MIEAEAIEKRLVNKANAWKEQLGMKKSEDYGAADDDDDEEVQTGRKSVKLSKLMSKDKVKEDKNVKLQVTIAHSF